MRVALGVRVAIGALVSAAVLTTGGCADFSQQDRARSAGPFSSDAATPARPAPSPIPSSPDDTGPPPTGPCVDPDPAVIATCLGATSALTAGDERGDSTVVAERTTGQIITASRDAPKRVVASVPVVAGGDGGLMDFAFSPTYDQDRLIYAYITTASDNRVVRIAPGDTPKPILTGIPRGSTGNMGSIRFRSPTEMLVATGDAGDPGLAAAPGSLAGKLLSVTALASGTNARPRVLASGLGSYATVCANATSGRLYVTDRTATQDRLQIIDTSGTLRPLWTWPDRPQVAGCAAAGESVLVSETRTQRVELLGEPTRDRPTVTPPVTVFERRYGALGRLTSLPSGLFQVGTVNKQTPTAGRTDDRVVRFLPPSSSESRL